jgi:hypothetical protein
VKTEPEAARCALSRTLLARRFRCAAGGKLVLRQGSCIGSAAFASKSARLHQQVSNVKAACSTACQCCKVALKGHPRHNLTKGMLRNRMREEWCFKPHSLKGFKSGCVQTFHGICAHDTHPKPCTAATAWVSMQWHMPHHQSLPFTGSGCCSVLINVVWIYSHAPIS